MDDSASAPDDQPKVTAESPLQITAFHRFGLPQVRVVPAPNARPWLNDVTERFASRCLPLTMANASGWHLLNPVAFRVTWNGAKAAEGVLFENLEQPGTPVSLLERKFGGGIITFTVPYLFRTSPGYNLLARGPANLPKDGIAALEGLVETDWAVTSFTVNWKITRADHPIVFERDEPYGLLVPQARGELERFQPDVRDLGSDSYLLGQYNSWAINRRHMNEFRTVVARFTGAQQTNLKQGKLEMDYVRGTSPGGASATHGHDTRRTLRPFTADDPHDVPDLDSAADREIDPAADQA